MDLGPWDQAARQRKINEIRREKEFLDRQLGYSEEPTTSQPRPWTAGGGYVLESFIEGDEAEPSIDQGQEGYASEDGNPQEDETLFEGPTRALETQKGIPPGRGLHGILQEYGGDLQGSPPRKALIRLSPPTSPMSVLASPGQRHASALRPASASPLFVRAPPAGYSPLKLRSYGASPENPRKEKQIWKMHQFANGMQVPPMKLP